MDEEISLIIMLDQISDKEWCYGTVKDIQSGSSTSFKDSTIGGLYNQAMSWAGKDEMFSVADEATLEELTRKAKEINTDSTNGLNIIIQLKLTM